MIHLTYVRKHTCGLGDTEKHRTKFRPGGSLHSVQRQKAASKHAPFQGAITSGGKHSRAGHRRDGARRLEGFRQRQCLSRRWREIAYSLSVRRRFEQAKQPRQRRKSSGHLEDYRMGPSMHRKENGSDLERQRCVGSTEAFGSDTQTLRPCQLHTTETHKNPERC